ncbi:MAG TPA: phosphatase PAP2 family protein [Solirubrobacteraceae bacterium]|nr:phosphatase PAP2 family protein [Solirubrobacteraceae bacterium]
MRRSKAIRATAWGVVAAGVLAPLVRRQVKAPPLVLQAVAFCAPVGLCVATRRSRARDVATCGLQMWAYVAAYKTPHDDAAVQTTRVHVDYPIAIDCALGFGTLPTTRLQRCLAQVGPDGPRWRTLDKVLVWAHWSWFLVPHGTLVYLMLRHPNRFERAATLTYAVFDVGGMIYWVLPTAPPWYAAAAPENGRAGNAVDEPVAVAHPEPRRMVEVRRMMVEYGESFWRDGWGPLYSVLGGNPLAAMPSLHFATSVMAALLLAESGPVAGAVGWAYAGTLGFALVYLGEHYVADLLGGAALTLAVRRLAPRAAPVAIRFARGVAGLEAIAHEERNAAA